MAQPLVDKKKTTRRINNQCPMPNAQCPMPHAPCPMPHAPCPMPHAPCPMPNALNYWRMLCPAI
ncbi:MAG: hypothetical protein ACYTXP_25485 [Nostoc sp.]